MMRTLMMQQAQRQTVAECRCAYHRIEVHLGVTEPLSLPDFGGITISST